MTSKLELTNEQVNAKCTKLCTKEHIQLHREVYKVQGKGAWVLYLSQGGSELPLLTSNHLFYVPFAALPCLCGNEQILDSVEKKSSENQIPFIIINVSLIINIVDQVIQSGVNYSYWSCVCYLE